MQHNVAIGTGVKKNTSISKTLSRLWNNYRFLYLLMIPGMAVLIIFHYLPLYGILIAFKDYNPMAGIMESPWVGLRYFRSIIELKGTLQVIKNTIEISLLRILFGFPAPIILALLFNELSNLKFKKITQTISYMPHFLSWVVVAAIMMEVLSPTRGAVAMIMRSIGLEPISFLTSPKYFRAILILTGIWKEVGWSSVIYIASIASIDTQLYEAAIIDGAGRFKRAIYITLPGLAPVITVLLILQISGILNAGFDQILNLYNPLVYEVADIIDTYIYRVGLTGAEYSLATAVGLMKNIVGFILLIISNTVTKRISEYGVW